MRRYLMPGTDLWAAPICLGTGGFTTDQEKQARDQLDCFVDLGGNLIDTANVYGQQQTGDLNRSEQVLGRWLQDRCQPADILISTKGGHPWLNDLHRSRLDPASLLADLDQSRQALGRDCLDLYFLHRDDPEQPVEAMLGQLEEFRQAGYIKYYGLSNWRSDRLQAALAWCSRQAGSGLAAVQNRWSLARFNPAGSSDDTTADVDEKVRDIMCRHDLSLLAYSAMAKGFFSKIQPQPAPGQAGSQMALACLPEKLRSYYLNDLSLRRAEATWRVAAAKNVQPAQIALAWLLHQPFPVFPIVSFSSLHQLEEAMCAPAIHLTPDEFALLSAGSDC